jgi:xanthine dehydrogenase accessory factor
MNWAAEALEMIESGPAAMVTLVHVSGSAPREAGTRMLVSADAISGTVGGGNLELQLIDQARRLMSLGEPDVLQQDYPLGPLLAQCCGGRVRVLIERLDASTRQWLEECDAAERAGTPYVLEGAIDDGRIIRIFHLDPTRSPPGADIFAPEGDYATLKGPWTRVVERISPVATHLYLFGAGHVGRAIAYIATTLPFHFHWLDNRPEAAEEDARVTIRKDVVNAVAEAPPGAFFLVLTHSHELDYALVSAILKRGDSRYCGLIGSATKRARFVSRLTKDGIDASQLTCPIGAGSIRSKAPAAIAVAASAELLVLLETSMPVKVRV